MTAYDLLGAYDETDLEALRFFADAAAISIDKAILHRQVMERSWVESQLRLAHEIQSRLLPAAPPQAPGYDLAGTSLSAYDVGGDYYDYIPLSRDRLAVVGADGAGKGVPAALMMATFRALLRTHLHIDQDLLELIDAVNRSLVESVGLPAFVTCVFGLLDLPTGRFAYANCGHNPPLIVRTRERPRSSLPAATSSAPSRMPGPRSAGRPCHRATRRSSRPTGWWTPRPATTRSSAWTGSPRP